MKIAVKSIDNKDVGEIELNDAVFGVEVRRDILARVVNWQLARRRAGTHKTKGVSEIRASNQKIYRQKGTGRARQGERTNAQFRGGATIFGPVVRDHAHGLTKKVRALGMRCALSAKAEEGKLIIIDDAKAGSRKTREMAGKLAAMGLDNVLFVGGEELDENFALATRNIPKVDLLPAQGANVYDILRRDVLVLTKDAVAKLEERLS